MNKSRLITGLFVALGLSAGVYYLWSTPRIQELFRPATTRREDPLAFLKEEAESVARPDIPTPEKPRKKQVVPREKGRVTDTTSEQEVDMSSSERDHEVARTLIGILKAKGLADHISLSVTRSRLYVYGEVRSDEEKQRILEVLNLGRGDRKLDDSQFTVLTQ